MTQSQPPSHKKSSKRQHAFLEESKPINSAQYYYKHVCHQDMESGNKFNVFEVFMLHSAPGGDSFAGIQAKHTLEYNRH